MEEEGFEPSKSLTTDLQSAPFGHSGTPPYWMWDIPAIGRTGSVPANRTYPRKPYIPLSKSQALRPPAPDLQYIGADDGTRTRNLLITNQLLCQLSYISKLEIKYRYAGDRGSCHSAYSVNNQAYSANSCAYPAKSRDP